MTFLSVVTPVFNGGKASKVFIGQLAQALSLREVDFELIVVDDGSTDQSNLASLEKEHRSVQVVFHEVNRGKGRAVANGIGRSTGALVVVVDGDGDIPVRSVLNMLDEMISADVDVMVANKFDPSSEVDVPTPRWYVSRAVANLMRATCGLPISDTQTGLKCFRGELVRQVAPLLQMDGYLFDAELLTRLRIRGASFGQCPVTIVRSIGGISTLGVGAYWQTFRDLVLVGLLALRLRRRAARERSQPH